MTMTPRAPECDCSITNEMVWAGPVIQLCHHSSAAEAEEAQEKLMDIMGVFAQRISPQEMFSKTIMELAEDYRKEAAEEMEHFLNREEAAIININFMRNLSLSAQMLLCSMIMQKEAGG